MLHSVLVWLQIPKTINLKRGHIYFVSLAISVPLSIGLVLGGYRNGVCHVGACDREVVLLYVPEMRERERDQSSAISFESTPQIYIFPCKTHLVKVHNFPIVPQAMKQSFIIQTFG